MPRESVPRRRVKSDVYLILLMVSFVALLVGTVLIYKRLYISYRFNMDPAPRAQLEAEQYETSWSAAGAPRPGAALAEFEGKGRLAPPTNQPAPTNPVAPPP
jgi:hypothetical protein